METLTLLPSVNNGGGPGANGGGPGAAAGARVAGASVCLEAVHSAREVREDGSLGGVQL